mmetsp:Transcript_9912/g.36959  ORF Transcript_9912/g.36959 Transcript_9912/m.36959 type:complete len:140 (+) Transcript_9912:1976-2395(+)
MTKRVWSILREGLQMDCAAARDGRGMRKRFISNQERRRMWPLEVERLESSSGGVSQSQSMMPEWRDRGTNFCVWHKMRSFLVQITPPTTSPFNAYCINDASSKILIRPTLSPPDTLTFIIMYFSLPNGRKELLQSHWCT